VREARGDVGTLLLAAVWASACDGEEDAASRPDLTVVTTRTVPRTPSRPPEREVIPGTGTLTAYVSRHKWLRARPGGRRLAGLRRRTEFDSPRILTVVARRGVWLGVLAPELRNGQVGWIHGAHGVRLYRTPWSIAADLSRRQVVVRKDGRVVRRVPVAIGRPGAPTPRGRFAVTDKLLTNNPGGPYGCCALALTGHQPSIPQGWGGGDRLAIHGTPAEHTIGQAASLGCLRAFNCDMRRIVREVPLGTRVHIRR
jgi:L,D-transpeptidase catalytic domain